MGGGCAVLDEAYLVDPICWRHVYASFHSFVAKIAEQGGRGSAGFRGPRCPVSIEGETKELNHADRSTIIPKRRDTERSSHLCLVA